jgi:hypothetical protein
MIGGRPASMNASSLSSSSLSESLSCDVHPTTGNILYCLKELSPGYSLVYRKMHDLALSYGILSRSMITIPNEVDDIVLSLLENLLLALETRAAQFDEQLKNNKSGGSGGGGGGGGGSHPGSNKSGQAGSTPGKREMNTKAHSLFEMEDKHAEESVLSARKHLFLANNFHSIFNYLKERTHRINNPSSYNNNSNPSPNEEKDKNPSTPSNPNRRGTNPGNNPIRQQKFLSYNERIEQK